MEVSEVGRRPTTSTGQVSTDENMRSKVGRPSLWQLVCGWIDNNKHIEEEHFEMEIKKHFLIKQYDISETEKLPIIKTG